MLLIIIKILSPIIAAYAIHKIIKLVWALSHIGAAANMKDKPRVIDICPECGDLAKPGHRCKRT